MQKHIAPMLLYCMLSPLWASSPHVLDKVIAIVNEDVITESEVNAEVQRLQMELTAKHTQVPPLSVLKKQVLKHLIDVDIQLQIAKGNHVDVENSEIDDTINKIAEHNRLSLSELRADLSAAFPSLSEIINHSLALNQSYIHEDILLKDGDEIALIPPVSGG